MGLRYDHTILIVLARCGPGVCNRLVDCTPESVRQVIAAKVYAVCTKPFDYASRIV